MRSGTERGRKGSPLPVHHATPSLTKDTVTSQKSLYAALHVRPKRDPFASMSRTILVSPVRTSSGIIIMSGGAVVVATLMNLGSSRTLHDG